LDRASQFDCLTWAQKVIDYLRENFSQNQRTDALKPVTDLATEMLSHLLIAGTTLLPLMFFHSLAQLEILEERRPLKKLFIRALISIAYAK